MPVERHDSMPSGGSSEAVFGEVRAEPDDMAFVELARRWRDRVTAACLRLTGNYQDAEDAAQEAFARAFAARRSFQGTASFSTWFWRIAVNVAHDMRRRRQPQTGLTEGRFGPQTDASANPERAAMVAERCDRIHDALQQLSDVQRTVVVLRHFEHMKFREIAEVLDVPVGTVASRMAEALTRLAQLLNTEQEKD